MSHHEKAHIVSIAKEIINNNRPRDRLGARILNMYVAIGQRQRKAVLAAELLAQDATHHGASIVGYGLV